MGKLDHKVPFPKAGKGFYLFFSMQSLAEIEDVYSADYFGDVERLLNMMSAKAAITCLNAGLRDADGYRVQLDFDKKQSFTIEELIGPVMEALSLSTTGKGYQELIDEMTKRRDEAAAKAKAAAEEAARKEGFDPFPAFADSSDTKPTDNSQV